MPRMKVAVLLAFLGSVLAEPGEKEQAWMSERVRYGLYHELVHAGHGPYASLPISENKIREQMGKDLRPEVDRKKY